LQQQQAAQPQAEVQAASTRREKPAVANFQQAGVPMQFGKR
jgi:hypothetical protein